ncbi:hypothetical protein [Bradyrhizobium brasilense]|uniref:Transposase n=1 Tax=Bradyrhizobium brasilense TaxID=1419277 RepID=A0ABY8JEY8_9BRAD|nr:hypothetical protein [Bradyrhizobium brasilense]WFU62568.1 hypothetical protein QA636_34670 [Bradyrhizobium brasilense]
MDEKTVAADSVFRVLPVTVIISVMARLLSRPKRCAGTKMRRRLDAEVKQVTEELVGFAAAAISAINKRLDSWLKAF